MGPEGEAGGALAERVELSNANQSFHLHNLKQAEVIRVRREGCSLFYSPTFDRMNALLTYLVEDCCQGKFKRSSC